MFYRKSTEIPGNPINTEKPLLETPENSINTGNPQKTHKYRKPLTGNLRKPPETPENLINTGNNQTDKTGLFHMRVLEAFPHRGEHKMGLLSA